MKLFGREIFDPGGESLRATLGVDVGMLRACSRHRSVFDHDQIIDRERGPRGSRQNEVDRQQVVELESLAIFDRGLEYRRITQGLAGVRVRLPNGAQVLDPGFFEIGQIPAVMHNPHGVGFGKADPDAVSEGVIVRVERRFGGRAHAEDGIGTSLKWGMKFSRSDPTMYKSVAEGVG